MVDNQAGTEKAEYSHHPLVAGNKVGAGMAVLPVEAEEKAAAVMAVAIAFVRGRLFFNQPMTTVSETSSVSLSFFGGLSADHYDPRASQKMKELLIRMRAAHC